MALTSQISKEPDKKDKKDKKKKKPKDKDKKVEERLLKQKRSAKVCILQIFYSAIVCVSVQNFADPTTVFPLLGYSYY